MLSYPDDSSLSSDVEVGNPFLDADENVSALLIQSKQNKDLEGVEECLRQYSQSHLISQKNKNAVLLRLATLNPDNEADVTKAMSLVALPSSPQKRFVDLYIAGCSASQQIGHPTLLQQRSQERITFGIREGHWRYDHVETLLKTIQNHSRHTANLPMVEGKVEEWYQDNDNVQRGRAAGLSSRVEDNVSDMCVLVYIMDRAAWSPLRPAGRAYERQLTF